MAGFLEDIIDATQMYLLALLFFLPYLSFPFFIYLTFLGAGLFVFSQPHICSSSSNVERKMARTGQEAEDDEDEDSFEESSEDEGEEEIKLTKQNYVLPFP